MAFNFYGVFTTGQWEAFKAFSKIQQRELVLRRQWLNRELTRVGIFSTAYDGNTPTSFTATGYAGKLLQAYRMLGGVPEQTMLLRTREQPVYKVRAQELTVSKDATVEGGFSDVYSNGRRERGDLRYDRDLGTQVEKLKSWQLETIKFKRERLEYKIKRAMDYSDQLQEEAAQLDKLLGSGRGSFQDQVISVEVTMARPHTVNIVENLSDQFGLDIGRVADFSFDDANEDKEAKARRG